MEWGWIFIAIAGLVVLFVTYLPAFTRCYTCGKKLKSKKYLRYDSASVATFHICEECFIESIVQSDPEEKSAN